MAPCRTSGLWLEQPLVCSYPTLYICLMSWILAEVPVPNSVLLPYGPGSAFRLTGYHPTNWHGDPFMWAIQLRCLLPNQGTG
jgi:hypothetical protein